MSSHTHTLLNPHCRGDEVNTMLLKMSSCHRLLWSCWVSRYRMHASVPAWVRSCSVSLRSASLVFRGELMTCLKLHSESNTYKNGTGCLLKLWIFLHHPADCCNFCIAFFSSFSKYLTIYHYLSFIITVSQNEITEFLLEPMFWYMWYIQYVGIKYEFCAFRNSPRDAEGHPGTYLAFNTICIINVLRLFP